MLRLIRSITVKQGVTEQLPALVGSVCIAEAFYKFHTFTLECGAFLATWFILDLLFQVVARALDWRNPVGDPSKGRPGVTNRLSGFLEDPMRFSLLPIVASLLVVCACAPTTTSVNEEKRT